MFVFSEEFTHTQNAGSRHTGFLTSKGQLYLMGQVGWSALSEPPFDVIDPQKFANSVEVSTQESTAVLGLRRYPGGTVVGISSSIFDSTIAVCTSTL